MDREITDKVCRAVVDAGLSLAHSSMTVGTYGNISCRVDENTIAITPSGRDYEQLTPSDIVIVNMEGAVLEMGDPNERKTVDTGADAKGSAVPLRPSSELSLHLAIYRHFPEARAIVHTHSIYASALAAAHKDLPAIVEDLTQIVGGGVRCTEYTLAGTEELGRRAVEAMEGGRSAALLANHGAVCWGRNMKEALTTAEILEKGAQIYCIAHSFGTPFPLNDKIARTLHEFYLKHYSKRQRGEE